MSVAHRQRGHLTWNASMTGSPAQPPARSTTASVSSSTVNSVSASASAIASTTMSICPGDSRAGPERPLPAEAGRADRAPVHIGRSRVGSRWTVPRGPNVLTRLRSVHRAARTSVCVASALRTPMDNSAADITWACAPQMAPTTSAGWASRDGAINPCRSRRRAVTSDHGRRLTVVSATLSSSRTPRTEWPDGAKRDSRSLAAHARRGRRPADRAVLRPGLRPGGHPADASPARAPDPSRCRRDAAPDARRVGGLDPHHLDDQLLRPGGPAGPADAHRADAGEPDHVGLDTPGVRRPWPGLRRRAGRDPSGRDLVPAVDPRWPPPAG